ncbi:thiolase family protein [Mesorhizobium sp. A623]
MTTGIVISAVCRTPFGRFQGALKDLSTVELGIYALDGLLNRAGLPEGAVDAAYVGVGMMAGGMLTPARRIVLGSRLPDSTPSLTVDRACCSGLTAIGLGFREIAAGEASVMICGGAESLSNTPRLMPRVSPHRPQDMELADPLTLRAPFGDTSISTYSGEEALANGVDRQQQDEWALASHERYFAAERAGAFAFERISVEITRPKCAVTLAADESPRAGTSLEALGKLRPVYSSPTITAGNAPGLSDGAAFLLLASEAAAEARELSTLARVIGYTQVAGGRTSGTSTPAVAIGKLLDRNGLEPEDLAAIEINEAYAATPLVSILKLAAGNIERGNRLRAVTNMHGGAVAIGHPLGASGARIVMSLINVLSRRGGGIGAAAICGGYGQGDALLVEVAP